ncbi:MAG: hypothetical protein IJX38_06985 [Clostridia bacterium]|nr:hypothetical protein [Clostridia bacterium]
MKKIITCALVALLALGMLASCGDDEKYYPPVDSTAEESAVVATMQLDGKIYEIRRELYDALYHSYGASTADSNAVIIERAADIYATLALASRLGFDPYSDGSDKLVKEYIYNNVQSFYNGDYNSYLAALSEQGLTYSVSDLLIRYNFAASYIDDIASPAYDNDLLYNDAFFLMSQRFTREDIREFYFSTECNRVLGSYIPGDLEIKTVDGITKTAEQLAEQIHASIDRDRYDISAVRTHLAKYSAATSPYELQNGFVFGKHTSDYRELAEEAMSLEVGELSDIIRTYDGRYYILFGIEKTEEHFDACYDTVKEAFLENKIGGMLDSSKDLLIESCSITGLD